jgi:putative Mg2+ transporter-C (MgtC) family protein
MNPVPADLPVSSDMAAVFFRLLLAAVLSGIVGWERERLRKPAGFRTHILVGIGSALVMLTSLRVPEIYPRFNVDPARIAAQVVVGIGFLGAGTILHSKEGWVSGLTTAASLWVVAGVGLAVGIGFYSAAITAWALVIVALYFLNRIDDYIERHLYHSVQVSGRFRTHLAEEVKDRLREAGVVILKSEFVTQAPQGTWLVVHFKPIKVREGRGLLDRLRRVRGVQDVLFD